MSSGNMTTLDMAISDNAEDQLMILNVLSSTLYSDKVAAVLREYSCNAADANVEAGRGEQPIEVRLPNKLDPTISIRDFGYGMDESAIANVFCRLGRSTKRNSNAFTGMLGIGSKAGFAYGDSFLVTSWTGGTKTVYNAYRDQGVPRLAKMHVEPSDAPDGIEVKVPVRQEDMQEFVNKAERVFRYFRVRPIIHGAQVNWDERKHEFAGTGWRYIGNGRSVAIMGNVGYDLNPQAMGLPAYANNPNEALLGLGVELDFEIGDLEIAASREGLQYKDHTKKAILARLQIIQNEIAKVFTGRISSAKSWWEAKRLFHERFENLNSYHGTNLRDVVGKKMMWNGTVLDNGTFNLENKEKLGGISVTKVVRRGTNHSTNMPGLSNYPNVHDVQPRDDVMLVLNDLPTKKNSPSRMRGAFAADASLRTIIVFTFTDAKSEKTYWKNRQLDGAPITMMSKITPVFAPTQAGGVSAHKAKHSAKVFVLDEGFTSNYRAQARSSWWKKEQVDIKTDGGAYVVIEFFEVSTGSVTAPEHPCDFLPKVASLRKAGLLTGPVYGIKRDKVAKLGPKWKPLRTAMNDALNVEITKKNFAQELADSLEAQQYSDLIDPKHASVFPAGSAMREHLSDVEKMRNPKAKQALLTLVHDGRARPWLDKPTLPEPSVDLDVQERTVLKLYPMIDLASLRDCDDKNIVQTCATYVKLIGK